MSSDQTAKHGLGRVCQKVGHGLSCIFSDKTSLIYIFGLAAFYTWNLVDIFAPPLVGSGGRPGIEVSTVVSSVCNVGSYVAIAALLSRFRSFFALAFAAAVAAAAVVLGAWGLWSVGLVGSPEALLAYKGVTRVCAAFVIVAWGMRFSELEGSALTQRALAGFCRRGCSRCFCRSRWACASERRADAWRGRARRGRRRSRRRPIAGRPRLLHRGRTTECAVSSRRSGACCSSSRCSAS